ncbi:MAG: hypothetical protein JNK26_03505, partial [Candidatus Doudnabacteria bacterium]|nr:hypothetical protein [Candidatus Doudnabacteria bacterium]
SLSRVDYRFVEVDVEYNGGFPDFSCVRLYVMETGDTSFSENKAYSISSSVRISDKRGKVIFDMGQQTNRSIFINRLRLDPACGGNPVITLHGIRLYNDLQAKAVYRFWSDKHQNHFYTADDNEKNDVLAKYSQSTWKYERVAFHAFDANINYPVSAGLYPVFRFWNNTLQGHFYTIDPNEAKDLVNHPERGWVFEFEAFQAFKAPYQNYTVPLYRFWSNSLQAHFFTTDEAEKNDLINNPGKGWTYEGVAFHVLP